MEIRVDVKGVSCHGSAPERGDNAIYKWLISFRTYVPLMKTMTLTKQRSKDLVKSAQFQKLQP